MGRRRATVEEDATAAATAAGRFAGTIVMLNLALNKLTGARTRAVQPGVRRVRGRRSRAIGAWQCCRPPLSASRGWRC